MKTPYEKFSGKHLWKVIDAAIEDLVDNQDLSESTAREYIVGYLVKCMVDAGWPEELGMEDRQLGNYSE